MPESPEQIASPVKRGDAAERARAGVLFGLAAYGFWGFIFPPFLKTLKGVEPLEILAQRVMWSMVVVWGILAFKGEARAAWRDFRRWSMCRAMLLSSPLIAANWLLFIWAIHHDRVLDASLGYFINPLVNVVLGTLVLRETMRPAQWGAVALATLGVGVMTLERGVPWIALGLAGTFALYGLVRKLARAPALTGLAIECTLMTPFAVAVAAWLGLSGRAGFIDGGAAPTLLLVLSGPATCLPLLWFACAARRLRFTTLGLLQYIAPTGQFILGVWLYDEPLSTTRLGAFALIWLGLAVYSADGLRAVVATRSAATAAAAEAPAK